MGGTCGFTGEKRYLTTCSFIGAQHSALCRHYIYRYIYIYVCVCVCTFFLTLHFLRNTSAEAHHSSGRYNSKDYTRFMSTNFHYRAQFMHFPVYNILRIIIISEVLNGKILRYVGLYRLLVRKPWGRKHIGRTEYGWNVVLKLFLGRKVLDRAHVNWDNVYCHSVVKMAKNFPAP
jgi:hypothetical protein